MRVLAVGAHPDDCELGAGATLARHAASGDEVSILVLSAGAASRGIEIPGSTPDALRQQATDAAKVLGADVCVLEYPDQRFDAVDFLNLVKSVELILEQVKPEHVYTHFAHDLNLDHRLTYQAVITACRPIGFPVLRIESCEVPSSTEWGEVAFRPTVFVDVAGHPLRRKLEALACYKGEMREAPHPRSADAVKALSRWRGTTAGVMDAEAFVLVREVR